MCASQTVDNWGTNTVDPTTGAVTPNTQCIIPGWNLFQFPTTYSMTNVCDQKVVQLDLVVDQGPGRPIQIVGKMYVFKDYSDNLYVTVSLNATYNAVGNVNGGAPGPIFGNLFQGQYLHAQPRMGGAGAAGSLWLWDQPTFTLPTPVTFAYNDMLVGNGR